MLIHSISPPRFNFQLNAPPQNNLNYQFCFLNKPFVNDDNVKDIYYKLLVWPKARTIIENFDFLIKINHQNVLKALEILEFKKINETDFDPFGDSYLEIKIPQALYQTKMEFAISYQAFDQLNYGKLLLNLDLFDPYQLDNQLIFYDFENNQSTNLLTWNLTLFANKVTFNATYPHLFSLFVDAKNLINQTIDYESVKKWAFLAQIDQYPQLKNFAIENLATTKKAYNFQPQFRWSQQENLNQIAYHLQLTNQLALVGEQIQEINQGPIGFKANPFVNQDQILNLSFAFLNQTYQFNTIIHQADLIYQSQWDGNHFEV